MHDSMTMAVISAVMEKQAQNDQEFLSRCQERNYDALRSNIFSFPEKMFEVAEILGIDPPSVSQWKATWTTVLVWVGSIAAAIAAIASVICCFR